MTILNSHVNKAYCNCNCFKLAVLTTFTKFRDKHCRDLGTGYSRRGGGGGGGGGAGSGIEQLFCVVSLKNLDFADCGLMQSLRLSRA